MRLLEPGLPPAGAVSHEVEVELGLARPRARSPPTPPRRAPTAAIMMDALAMRSSEAGPSRLPAVDVSGEQLAIAPRRPSIKKKGSARTTRLAAPVESSLPPQPPYADVRSLTAHTRPVVHPYLSGNYAPIDRECRALTPCAIVEGRIPPELAGGQYVRNGGNPSPTHMDNDRASHWFDGDGMLAGVLFRSASTADGADDGTIEPLFVNRYVVTDVHRITPPNVRRPIIPSIATLIAPSFSYIMLLGAVLRAFLFYALTWLPGLGFRSRDDRASRLSVANATIWWHDGRALAGCESGPPMQVKLPTLETVAWYTAADHDGRGWGKGLGALHTHFMEYTTAHPKLDPQTGEMLLYHMSLVRPYLRVSVVPSRRAKRSSAAGAAGAAPLLGARVPGLAKPKLMHDFACTRTRTVIIDHPLTLDAANLARGANILDYDPRRPARFGVFPRHEPHRAQWTEAPDAFVVFHTANAWDEHDGALSLLACRMNGATLAYTAGNLQPPAKAQPPAGEPERCQLYYWRFEQDGRIAADFALSNVPFEFPTLDPARLMSPARFVFGTSTRNGSFDASLKLAAKIDCLVKMDVRSLVERGRKAAEAGLLQRTDAVDERTAEQILQKQALRPDEHDDISIFAMPQGWYAQEASFVPRRGAQTEDDGYLLFYAFDESTGLDPLTGTVWPDARSELWIVDARDMRTLVARVRLPQRVPYGLHGNFFTPEQIAQQQLPSEADMRSARFDAAASAAAERSSLQRAVWSLKHFIEQKIA